MKKEKQTVALLLLLELFIVLTASIVTGAKEETKMEDTKEESEVLYLSSSNMVSVPMQEITLREDEPENEPEKPENIYHLTLEEQNLLATLAMCEAGNQDTKGKALVIRVVLNRVADERFPDNVRDVIYQSDQFAPVSNGRINSTVPDDDCYAALGMANMEDWDESEGAIYFCAKSIHFGWADYLFTYGGHKFFK